MSSSTEEDAARMAKVQTDSRERTPDEFLMDEALENILFQTITFQGFLARFSDIDVRRAYVEGHFGVSEYSDASLESIDIIRNILLPFPNLVNSEKRTAIVLAGVQFFSKLLAHSLEEPVDLSGHWLPSRKSYKDWHKYLGSLSRSDYWQRNPNTTAKDRSNSPSDYIQGKERAGFGKYLNSYHSTYNNDVKDIEDGASVSRQRAPLTKPKAVWDPCSSDELELAAKLKKNVSSRSFGMKTEKHSMRHYGKRGVHKDESSEEGVTSGVAIRKKHRKRKSARSNRGNLRRIKSHSTSSTSSGSSTESTESSSNGDSSSDSDSSDERRPKGHGRSRKNKLYSVLKRINSHKDVVLPGKYGGKESGSLKYFMKEYEKYFSAKYDGSERQQSQQLEQFLEGPIRRAYDAMEGSKLKYRLLKEKLLDWYRGEKTNVRHRSESDFRKARMMSDDSLRIYALRLECIAGKAFPESKKERQRQLRRKFWKTAPQSFSRAMADSERNLSLLGHQQKLSWKDMLKLAEAEDRHQKKCRSEYSGDSEEVVNEASVWFSRPGSKEDTSNVSRVPPINSATVSHSDRAQLKQVRFTESNKGGNSNNPSWEKNSQSRTWSTLICNWCGRRGHVENSCWAKAGSCRICGSTSHSKDNCPAYDPTRSVFSPECSRCGGGHLGRNCEQSALN